MDAHGYLFRGFAGKVSPDYIPSLIGCTPDAVHGTNSDAYFERVEITDRTILKITSSRWWSFDSAIEPDGDPIVIIEAPIGSYYLPLSELEEIAASNQDDDTWALIDRFKAGCGR